jgi:prophage DNA circulation protein
MAAFQQLIPASFRGVPFLCPQGTKDGGRHAVKHDYPDSNTRFVEDNGLIVPDFKIHCVVHGVDAIARLRRLEAAINTPGPGTLVHPIHGRQFVQAGKYSVKHDDKEVGVYSVECEFHVTGPANFPGLITGIAASISGLSASAIGALFAAFSAGLDGIASARQFTQATTAVLTGAVGSVTSVMTRAFGEVAGIQSAVDALTRFPERALSDVTGLARQFETMVRAPLGDLTVSQQRLFDGFVSLHETAAQITYAAALIVPNTDDLFVRQSGLLAIGSTMQVVAFASICEVVAGKKYATSEQVSGDIATVSQMRDALPVVLLSAADVQRLTRLYADTVAVLAKEQVALPEVREIRVHQFPASVLAYQLYETDADLQTIIGLNAGRNPILYDGTVNILRNA